MLIEITLMFVSSPPRKKLKPAEDSEEEDGGEYVLKERDMVEDDEQTLDQEEAHGDIDHQAELDELEKEGRKRIIPDDNYIFKCFFLNKKNDYFQFCWKCPNHGLLVMFFPLRLFWGEKLENATVGLRAVQLGISTHFCGREERDAEVMNKENLS